MTKCATLLLLLIPAGESFLLDSTGIVTTLLGNGEKLSESIHQVGGASTFSHYRTNIRLLNGLKIVGYTMGGNSPDTLLALPDAIALESVKYTVKGGLPYNRVMACFRSDTTAVSEITFYDTQNRIVTPDHIESDIIPFNKEGEVLWYWWRVPYMKTEFR